MTGSPVNVDDFEEAARARLEPGAYGYFAGGAGDEHTLRANAAAFAGWELRPRVLVDVGEVSTATTVLGTELLPLLVAPTAFQRLADPEGELATARAAASAGTVMTLSTLSSVSPGELAAAAPGAPSGSSSTGRPTAASPRSCRWWRRRGTGRSSSPWTFRSPAGASATCAASFALPTTCRCPTSREARARGLPREARRHRRLDLTWRDLEWLRSCSPLPLVLKGILTAEDALLAVEHGAAGVIVSNHGGRQLDGVAATLDALPDVVEAVGDRIEVLFDGGIRRGTDVLKALALGARAAMSGRAVLWGLAAGGEEGARQVLELLRSEIEVGLKLLGCTSPAEITRAHVRRAGSHL